MGLVAIKNKEDNSLVEGDGPDNPDLGDILSIEIKMGLNGYVVEYEFDEIIQRYVFTDFDEALMHIRSMH